MTTLRKLLNMSSEDNSTNNNATEEKNDLFPDPELIIEYDHVNNFESDQTDQIDSLEGW